MPFDTTRVAALHCGDAAETMHGMRPGSVDAIITSRPYAQQRHFQYGGVAKRGDPEWTAAWMEAARPLLKPGGSLAIVIRADWPRRARRALGDRDRPQARTHRPRATARHEGHQRC